MEAGNASCPNVDIPQKIKKKETGKKLRKWEKRIPSFTFWDVEKQLEIDGNACVWAVSGVPHIPTPSYNYHSKAPQQGRGTNQSTPSQGGKKTYQQLNMASR